MNSMLDKSQKNKGLAETGPADPGRFGVNEAGTGPKIDAWLTRPLFSGCSLRRALIAQREKHGADTEIGHRITNLIGQTDFLPAAFGEHRKNLEALIAKGTAELAELTLPTN